MNVTADWFPMPRYWGVRLAAMGSCGHIIWTSAGGWPSTWIGPAYCPACDQVGEIRQWWYVR